MGNDPYFVLQLPRDADDKEIKAAYERRITGPLRDGHLEMANRINAAYEVLRDPRRRALFDRHGVARPPSRGPKLHYFASQPPTAWRTWAPADPPAPHRVERAARHTPAGTRGLIALVVIAIVAGLTQSGLLRRAHALSVEKDSWHAGSVTVDRPPVRFVAHPRRILAPVPVPAGTGGYTFQTTGSTGRPIRFDPCRSIRYVVSGPEPFPGANSMLTSAVGEVSEASGLQFVYAGNTSEPASSDRAPYQPQRYGRRWAPVLVAWTDGATVPRLEGQVMGLGGPSAATDPDGQRLVTGIVYLDAPQLAQTLGEANGTALTRNVMVHELGHLIGLGHVNDPTSVMYPVDSAVPALSIGDRRGFAAAGHGTCSRYS